MSPVVWIVSPSALPHGVVPLRRAVLAVGGRARSAGSSRAAGRFRRVSEPTLPKPTALRESVATVTGGVDREDLGAFGDVDVAGVGDREPTSLAQEAGARARERRLARRQVRRERPGRR